MRREGESKEKSVGKPSPQKPTKPNDDHSWSAARETAVIASAFTTDLSNTVSMAIANYKSRCLKFT